jgi:hypothetical protein
VKNGVREVREGSGVSVPSSVIPLHTRSKPARGLHPHKTNVWGLRMQLMTPKCHDTQLQYIPHVQACLHEFIRSRLTYDDEHSDTNTVCITWI